MIETTTESKIRELEGLLKHVRRRMDNPDRFTNFKKLREEESRLYSQLLILRMPRFPK